MMSSPVAAQSIAPDFNATDGFYLWNEISGLWIDYADAAFLAANGGSNNFVPARGYAVSYPSAVTKTFTGILNQGNVSNSLTSSIGMYQGWNFIANPYPSSINWNTTTGWSRTMLEDAGSGEKAIWIWNADAANYGAYISNTTIGTNGVSHDIALTQGFWVKAATTGVFSMDNSVREHANPGFLKSTITTPEMIRLKVTGTTNTYSDEIIINFGNSTAEGGAEKMFSLDATAPSVYSLRNMQKYSINPLTTIDEYPVVPIGFKAGVDGNYSFNFSGQDNFTIVVLEDLKTGIKKNLKANNSFQFTALTSDNAYRFLLHFKDATSITETTTVNPQIYYTDQKINIFNPYTGQTIVQVYDISGRIISSFKANYGIEDYKFDYAPAVYFISLRNGNNKFTTKIVKW